MNGILKSLSEFLPSVPAAQKALLDVLTLEKRSGAPGCSLHPQAALCGAGYLSRSERSSWMQMRIWQL